MLVFFQVFSKTLEHCDQIMWIASEEGDQERVQRNENREKREERHKQFIQVPSTNQK